MRNVRCVEVRSERQEGVISHIRHRYPPGGRGGTEISLTSREIKKRCLTRCCTAREDDE